MEGGGWVAQKISSSSQHINEPPLFLHKGKKKKKHTVTFVNLNIVNIHTHITIGP